MSIRYFAISIDDEDYQTISAGPCPTCGSRPHPRERDYTEPEPKTLDLDKLWRYLQWVFNSARVEAAAQLVAGDVTHTPTGWISHQGVVSPDHMEEVAAELASVTPDQVRSIFLDDGDWRNERAEQDFEYTLRGLAAAVEFAEDVAGASHGVVYYIG